MRTKVFLIQRDFAARCRADIAMTSNRVYLSGQRSIDGLACFCANWSALWTRCLVSLGSNHIYCQGDLVQAAIVPAVPAGGFQGIPIGTTVLMSALCGPFCNPNGFPVPIFASQPFMVWVVCPLKHACAETLVIHMLSSQSHEQALWSTTAVCFQVLEHRQLYRLLTASLLHRNLAHLTNNLSSLAHSGSRLETKVGLPAFAAMATSLMLSSNALEGNQQGCCFVTICL